MFNQHPEFINQILESMLGSSETARLEMMHTAESFLKGEINASAVNIAGLFQAFTMAQQVKSEAADELSDLLKKLLSHSEMQHTLYIMAMREQFIEAGLMSADAPDTSDIMDSLLGSILGDQFKE